MKNKAIVNLWLLLLLIPISIVLVLLQEQAFRFEHKIYLWLLAGIIPALLLFFVYQNWKQKKQSAFAAEPLFSQLATGISYGRQVFKFLLLMLAYELVVIGFANPQIGTRQEKVKRKGIDVMIAIDVSNSMMSEDVKPNRLMRAKNFVSNFMDELKNDRLGMIVFAGKAYQQMPLTVDYSAGNMYLKSINTNLAPTQGTDIAEAITLAMEAFPEEDEGKSKALIIITDGEDNEGGTDEAIAAAVKSGVKLFTLGVGTDNGGPIPIGNDFKRDESGNIVLSKMNPQMLREIADKGNGKYFQLGSGKDEIDAILRELGGISKKEMEELVFTDYDDQFFWCLLLALIFLLTEWFIPEKKNGLSAKSKLV